MDFPSIPAIHTDAPKATLLKKRDSVVHRIMDTGSSATRLSNPAGCFDNVIAENTISHTDGIGIYLSNNHRSSVVQNIIDNAARVQRDDTEPVAAIGLNTCDAMVVQGNAISRSGHAGISTSSGRAGVGDIVISNNVISGSAGFGIQIRGILENVKVNNNTVSDSNGGVGSFNDDAQEGIEILDNDIRSIVGRPGIWLSNAARSAVERNTISDCATYSMDLTVSDNESTVSDNVIGSTGPPVGPTSNKVRITRPPAA